MGKTHIRIINHEDDLICLQLKLKKEKITSRWTKEHDEVDKYELKKERNELVKAGLSLSAASSYLAKKKNLPKKIIYNLH